VDDGLRQETIMAAPNPDRLYPNLYGPHDGNVHGHSRVAFLKPLCQHPFTTVGDYTYYDDPDGVTEFERRNVLYHYGPERLVIGRYCALATGVTFLMAGASHRMGGVSTYPFPLMGGDWLGSMPLFRDRERRGDTVLGNDVWLGYRTTVLPGVRIGDGAVVGSASVVTADVPPYAIVAGNPARVVRMRFADPDIERLQRLAWWDWSADEVTAALPAIIGGDVDAVEKAAQERGVAGRQH
jgi:virginiamycin A acetyltransferase